MKLLKLSLISLFFLSHLVYAANRKFVDIPSGLAMDTGHLKTSEVQSSLTVAKFSNWKKTNPLESEFLSLFPNYSEPTVKYFKNGKVKTIDEKLVMFVARSATLLNVSPSRIDLSKAIDLKNIAALNGTIQHKSISQDELLVTQLASPSDFHPRIENFEWCNKGGSFINRPKKEIDMSHLSGHSFCQGSKNSICIESCYIFPDLARGILNIAIHLLSPEDSPDTGLASQSELRYFNSEAQYGSKIKLSDITHIDTPVTGVLEQNIFYFNQIFQFGKVVTVLQKDPNDPNKTAMSNFVVLAVRERSLKQWGKGLLGVPTLEDVLRYGLEEYKTESEAGGLLSGVPEYSKTMTNKMATFLEENAN